MWFKRKQRLPGIHQHRSGQVSFTLTGEEQAEIDSLFRMMQESGEGTELRTWYIHPEAHKAMTAWALISYARSQVTLTGMADEAVVDKDLCFRKALAAASKAFSLHPLPI